MTDQKTDQQADQQAAPPVVDPHAHKNPPVGPKSTKPLSDWNQFRDYENFNPTPEK